MELKIQNLYKFYRNKEALKNINLTLRCGTYGLLGENGAGKSTLMRILTTVDFASKGSIQFNGSDIIELDEKYREKIGYMPQDFNVYPSFTAKDFLEYMGALKGITPEVLKQKIPQVLEFVNLSEVANKKVSAFSGGMKRRIGIAQAILNDPKILILDEPTAGLDPKERIRFANIISSMSKDKIVILSTHIVSDIEAIANNLIVIKSGEILQSGEINLMVSSVAGKIWETVVEQTIFEELSTARQIIRRKQETELIRVRYAGEAYDGIDSRPLEPNLEDYYMYVWR
ncbi:ABC transporter ATP-binding protein [Lysinibacillus sp. NPDC096418]|uniref:ABC transporter ATP-binding protein n=1 Tax=Lysinibacillus sp. NPDC096418 TaxID=3364138 RepID=UPI0038185E3D